MIICAISDSHGVHRKLEIPKCDIFLFCGDAGITSLDKLNDFNQWLGELDAQHKIITMGNHDGYVEEIGKEWAKQLFTNAIYLENDSCEIMGLKFWGSPFSVLFNNWSFMLPDNELKKIWETIPEDTDIVLTHGPAYGILDQVGYHNISQGSVSLRDRLKEVKLKMVFSAHIHEHGSLEYFDGKTRYFNCSVLNDTYHLENKPTIVEI